MWIYLFFSFIILYEIAVSMANQSNCKCGVPSDDIISVRIVGGRRAEPHSFPWTVAILDKGQLYCGGALITDRHVLSAGHCFKWNDIKFLSVFIGLDDMYDLSNVENRTIVKAVIHEEFKSTVIRDENDISIATLNEPVQFSSTVVPICLPEPNQDFGGRVGTIVGWGRLGVEQPTSHVLMKASLPILTDSTCNASSLGKYLKPTMMCTFVKGKDGCQGDSGGPLVVFEGSGKYVMAGIVSWGIGCANPKYPGVYTKVSNYIDWIERNSLGGKTCN